MHRRSDGKSPPDSPDALRDKLIGLGERSIRKSYYPELQSRIFELERFRALLDQTNEAIFLASAEDGLVVDCNVSASQLLQRPEEEITGSPFSSILQPITEEQIDARLAKAGDTSRLLDAIETELERGGEIIPVEFSLRIVRMGDETYVVAVARDITDRKRTEDELAAMNRRLEELVEERTLDLEAKARELEEANRRLTQLDALKSNFLSAVSHDLRTPLTAIQGFAKIIDRDFKRSFLGNAAESAKTNLRAKRISENLGIIHEETRRLTRLISDLLDISKIESGTTVWKDEVFDFATLAERAEEAVRFRAKAKRCRVELDINLNTPLIEADPDRIMQVLINLLDNAVKFSPGGTVRLRTREEHNGGAVRLSVADTGPGIPKHELSAIFDTFHQAKRDDTLPDGVERGTGLGLSICREIVEHYGGSIWAESELGHGATFHVVLPAVANGSRKAGDMTA
ncbi:PAS domain-containing sensor histidine kinase [Oceanidesulfovibrio marinus]|uniref:histidine kinase n=1 Tax=Oceanidesulfovibrio marinus TaxID=370038 RepID=A0ABX6NIE8_9BACT|nr:PAS domain-containing sensor histidine kinase [Oceanidesulfovibrio marinus]QJT10411.1 PAS domain S-box protein [Oceanidesulfovibrio marinus]